MAAGLQRHIHHSALWRLLAGCQSISFCVELTASLVISLPDDPVILYNHRSHHGIGTGKAPGFPRQLYGSSHIFFRLHTHHLSDFAQSDRQESFPIRCDTAGTVCAGQTYRIKKYCTTDFSVLQDYFTYIIQRDKPVISLSAHNIPSSSIQTVLSAPESHRILPYGSRAHPVIRRFTAGGDFHPALKNTFLFLTKNST